MADDPIVPPVVPQGWVGGVTVVDIGEFRVSRGLTRRPHSLCRHLRTVYDIQERRIWCSDCEKDVDPFDAFVGLVSAYGDARRSLERDQKELEQTKAEKRHLIAARNLEAAWRSRTMIPACPHCSNGLLPEDFKTIGTKVSKSFELAKRKAKAEAGS